MPGNSSVYEQVMNAGHNAAWEENWVAAIQNYGRAIQEFPDDMEAHLALGFGLLRAGRFDDALKVYTRAHQIAPEDPIPLEKSADILERLGRLREAAQQYINVSELYLGQRDLNKTIDNWERATHLTPGLVNIHAKLAQAYERIGNKQQTVRQYLILAYNFQRLNDADKALKSVQRALKLDPKNSLIMNTLRALETGQPIGLPPDTEDRQPDPDEAAHATKRRTRITSEDLPIINEANPLGPMGEAMADAMGMLAMHVVETGMMDATGASALQALELHRQGLRKEAIKAYLSAENKLRHPALKLNLGVLLMMEDKAEDAVKHLPDAINHPQLAAGGYHALGMAYKKLNKHRQAVKWLAQAIQSVDTGLATSDEGMELVDFYPRLLQAVERQNEETIIAIASRFANLLQGKDWKTKIPETRRQLEETLREESEQAVIDLLVAAHGERLTASMEAINRYMRQGLTSLAMDEAHYVVEFSPYYLPIHERMAEIMMREGRVRQAIAKYNVIASVYMARGDKTRATKILHNILDMAPLDLTVRQNLITLLEEDENMEALVAQYVGLADTYNQLGDSDNARETYGLAERTAARANAPVGVQIQIKDRVADLELLRADFRRAQMIYDDILQLDPNNESAYLHLIEIHHRAGNQVEATKRLDALLGIYARGKNINRILELLQQLVKQYPNDVGVRSRFAQILVQMGRKRDAIHELDAVGELQLEAGLHKQAAETIRRIISLNPPNIEDYRRLLGQLGG